MDQFDQRRALVTGGARGIGFEIARELGCRGARLVLADLRSEELDEAAQALSELGHDVETVVVDVTDFDRLEAVRTEVHRVAGPVHMLVNNAGVVFGGPFLDVPLERHLTTFRVNTEGLVAMTHTFLTDLVAADEGHLVNIASASGYVGLPYGSTYAASKWAAIGFSNSIRLELEKSGHDHVGVTTVCPGYVDTGMFEGAKAPKLTSFLTPEELAKKVVGAIAKRQPFVLEPWLVKFTPFLAHAFPTRVTDRLADLFGASTSMAGWTGRSKRVKE